jgi:ABC-type multidrug transport system fused ATPase/permease subunit
LRLVSPLYPLRTIVTNSFYRLYDFGEGSFRINDTDVRRYAAEDLHLNTSAVFQEFSQFNATLRENVGVGMIKEMESDLAVKEALQAGGGARLLEVLPQGLDSVLDDGFGFTFGASPDRRSLSGGEVRTHCISPTGHRTDYLELQWQRVAISRAFMRPHADLYVFDEANSALDAAAQNELFEKITNGCITTTNGQTRKKTVIYVTHRLSTVRKADKSTCYLFLCELANLT